MIAINERQRHAMRHALGLTNPDSRRKSYRNRYAATPGTETHHSWLELVAAGFATQVPIERSHQLVHFNLTLRGANAVLEPGEKLDMEDFD